MWLAVNPWAVLLAASVAWLAGVGYYTLMAGPWVKALGSNLDNLQRELDAKAGTPAAWTPFLLAYVAELVMASVLAAVLYRADALDLAGGVVTGAALWLGLVATTLTVNNTLAGRKPMLSAVDGGHWLLVLLVMGAILGVLG